MYLSNIVICKDTSLIKQISTIPKVKFYYLNFDTDKLICTWFIKSVLSLKNLTNLLDEYIYNALDMYYHC